MFTDHTQGLERFCSGNGIRSDMLGHHSITELPSDYSAGGPRNSYIISRGGTLVLWQSSGEVRLLLPPLCLRHDLAGRCTCGNGLCLYVSINNIHEGLIGLREVENGRQRCNRFLRRFLLFLVSYIYIILSY